MHSRTSEQRVLLDSRLCPPFEGCPLLGGCLIFALYINPLILMSSNFSVSSSIVCMIRGEVRDDVVITVTRKH